MTLFYIGKLDESESSDVKGIRTYKEYHKIVSERSDTPYVLWSDPNIPNEGSAHSQDPNAYVQGRSVKGNPELINHGGVVRLQWILEMNYSTEVVSAENPLNVPANIWTVSEVYQKPLDRNRDEDIIINKAGSPVRGLFRDDTRGIIKVEKNIGVDAFPLSGVPDVLNDAVFTIRSEAFVLNSLKFRYGGVSKTKKMNGISYQVLSFSLHYREDLWKTYHPNEGFYQKISGNDYLSPCFDSRGGPATSKMPLLANGEQATQTDINTNGVISLEEDVYPEVNMTTLIGSLIT